MKERLKFMAFWWLLITGMVVLICTLDATEINPALTTTIDTNATTTIQNQYGDFDYYWDFETNIPVGLGSMGFMHPYTESNQLQRFFSAGCYLTNLTSVSGSQSLWVGPGQFQETWNFNNSNYRKWAYTHRGTITFYWHPNNHFTENVMLFQMTGKSRLTNGAVGPWDSEDGVVITSESVGGGNAPGLGGGAAGITIPEVQMFDDGNVATNVWHKVTISWNTNALRTVRLQIDNQPPTWTTNTAAPTKCAQWHHLLLGNDTVNSWTSGFLLDDFTIYNTWTNDLCGQAWQGFEFDTLTTGNLEANDHTPNPARTWALAGTTSRFSISASGQATSPSTINGMEDEGTRGLANDLTSTAAGSVRVSFNVATAPANAGFWVKFPALSAGTTARIAFAADGSDNELVRFNARNTAGVYTLHITGTAESSGVTTSTDTWYWIGSRIVRNGTCTMQVYSVMGILVGEVTATGQNRSFVNWGFGSLAATTAQAGGSVLYVDNLVLSSIVVTPFKPWQ